MKTVHGLLHQVVDYLTAAIGWIDMSDKDKAVKELRLAIGVVMEVKERLDILLTDLEHDIQLKIHPEVRITSELKPEVVLNIEPTVTPDVAVKLKAPEDKK